MFREVTRSFLTYLGLAGANAVVGFISLPYLTRVLTPAEFGFVGLALARFH
jgi:O-antigen/teichoic acid export membrane protein